MKFHSVEASQSAETSRTRPLRVLCAEDDEPLAVMLKMALERAGHWVERVADGREALERIASDLKHFELLITDHEMPHLSGLGLVEKLRALAFPGKIIVQSSALREVDAASYRRLAVDFIFAKPVPLADLLDAIQRTGTITR